jgi:hypothetical protein
LRRVLAIWRPISRGGIVFTFNATSSSISNDQFTPATAEMFSASLYLRSIHGHGETHLTTRLDLIEKLLKAVDGLIEP